MLSLSLWVILATNAQQHSSLLPFNAPIEAKCGNKSFAAAAHGSSDSRVLWTNGRSFV